MEEERISAEKPLKCNVNLTFFQSEAETKNLKKRNLYLRSFDRNQGIRRDVLLNHLGKVEKFHVVKLKYKEGFL